MYFIVHLQNNKSTKSQSTDNFFFVLFWKEYMQIFISQLQQTVPQTKREERSWIQSNFHKACLSAGELEHMTTGKRKETQKRMTFLADYMGAGIPLGVCSPRSENLLNLAFSDHPSQPANTLCASYFLLFCHHNKRVQQQSMLPQKSIHFDKKVGTFKKT